MRIERQLTFVLFRAILVDPKGNTITLDVGTFTTPARSRYNNETNAIPGPLECFHFDYGGDGIGSYSYRGKPYFHWSRPDSAVRALLLYTWLHIMDEF